ncbi:MAG: GatB/YqeY domain-containing protein [Arenicellales bacterium]|nr:GatB/YqeY domain-containing protein [Arenicellales bacterium]
MGLKERINDDMKEAMRAKDSQKLESIRLLRAAIQRREVDERVDLDDEGVISVVQKQLKQCQDAIAQFTDGGRDDLVAKEGIYRDVLQAYMPKQMEEEEIDKIVQTALDQTGARNMRDMGKVMGVLKPQLQGKADMGLVSQKVKAKLQE